MYPTFASSLSVKVVPRRRCGPRRGANTAVPVPVPVFFFRRRFFYRILSHRLFLNVCKYNTRLTLSWKLRVASGLGHGIDWLPCQAHENSTPGSLPLAEAGTPAWPPILPRGSEISAACLCLDQFPFFRAGIVSGTPRAPSSRRTIQRRWYPPLPRRHRRGGVAA